MIRNPFFPAALLGLVPLLCGCGPYSFSGSTIPGHIKTVAVPLMENQTDRGDLTTLLADQLVEAILDDNKLRVASGDAADSVIEGVILEYRRTPFTFDANENVETYKSEITIEARFVDVRKNDVIWEEKRLYQWATYNFAGVGGQPPETELDGILRVLLKLTNDIMNRTVQGW